MSAEIAKLRYLSFPRWTAAGIVGVALLAGALLIALQPTTPGWYEDMPPLAVGTAYLLASIVFGVWSATLEFASGTLQRTLTAEPARSRVAAQKLLLACAGTLLIGLVALGTVLGLADVAAARSGVDYDQDTLARGLAAVVPSAVAGTAMGFGLGLLTRSMGAGIALAMAVVFALDGVVSMIPTVGDWSFGQLTGDLQSGIAGHGDTVHGIAVSIAGTLAWCALLLAPGWIAFLQGDLK